MKCVVRRDYAWLAKPRRTSLAGPAHGSREVGASALYLEWRVHAVSGRLEIVWVVREPPPPPPTQMPALETLPRVELTPLNRMGLLVLRAYLVIAVVMVIIRVYQVTARH
jgi:hypothetical protein